MISAIYTTLHGLVVHHRSAVANRDAAHQDALSNIDIKVSVDVV